MSAVVMPRLTMLMTSVSASTAQMLLTGSGSSRSERQRPDVLERDAEVARDVLEELSGARRALARHAVREHPAALVDPHARARAARRRRARRAPTAPRKRAPRAWVVMP